MNNPLISGKEFYGIGLGSRLIDPVFFPGEIKQFLREEEGLLNSIRPLMDGIVEVGCMHGRHLDWAVHNSMRYTGIDVIDNYIEQGRNILRERHLDPGRYKLILGCAEDLAAILPSDSVNACREVLLFPFNSLGNMSTPEPVLQAIKDVNRPFLITSYCTTQWANQIRHQYYSNCGYHGLQRLCDKRGVQFVSSDGLSSWAYHPEYLADLFRSCGFNAISTEFADIGIAYTNFELSPGPCV